MRTTSLIFLKKDNKVLLSMKKRGLGVGRLNGIGGKCEEGETLDQSIVRELYEEISVSIDPKDLQPFGTITFLWTEKPNWNQICHVYIIEKWKGEPQESEEMNPAGWFSPQELPFEDMWEDDAFWLPHVLMGKSIEATFHFDGENKMSGHKVIVEGKVVSEKMHIQGGQTSATEKI